MKRIIIALVFILFFIFSDSVFAQKTESGKIDREKIINLFKLEEGCQCAVRGDLNKLKDLIKKNPAITTAIEASSGARIAECAVIGKNIKVVKYLVEELKFDVNSLDKSSGTLLHFCAIADDVEIAKYLISKGAKINIQDSTGQTALHVASTMGSDNMVSFLIKNGADVTTKEKNGFTALDFAKIIDESLHSTDPSTQHRMQTLFDKYHGIYYTGTIEDLKNRFKKVIEILKE